MKQVNLNAVKIILRLLEKSKIDVVDYIKYINEIAKLVNIDKQRQEENFKKNAGRGRKKANSGHGKENKSPISQSK